MPIDAHRTPWTRSRRSGTHALRTTLAVSALSIGLTGCGTTPEPRTVVEYRQVICPMQVPQRVCPMRSERPNQFEPRSAMGYIFHLEYERDCWLAREDDWQALRTACHDAH